MTPQFSRLVNPFFRMVLEGVEQLQRRMSLNLELFRQKLVQELNDAEQGATESPLIKAEDFSLAKKALIYWADEVLTEADARWKDTILERQFYNTRDRGVNFYIIGEKQAKSAHSDVTEVWYLCLALGFVGDIEEAFRMHLNRELPTLRGDTGAPNGTKARRAWAEEIRAQMRPTPLVPPPGRILEGALSQLPGQRLLPMAIAALLTGIVLLSGLWIVDMRLKRAEGAEPSDTQVDTESQEESEG